MNYYGTRRRGHDLVFHSELRDALFASGLPFVLSINDVPEAWELYSRAGTITRLCSGKNGSKPELLSAGLRRQLCAQRRIARPAPGPNPTLVWSEVGFPTSLFQAFCALFGPKRER